MKEQIEALIKYLEDGNDFEDEFYLTYIGTLNDGDISDWHNNHFDDSVALGCDVGQTMLADEIIGKLKQIIGE
jgi:hypothetical protein